MAFMHVSCLLLLDEVEEEEAGGGGGVTRFHASLLPSSFFLSLQLSLFQGAAVAFRPD